MSSEETINPDTPSGSNSKDAMFEPKPKPKMIRVLTVLAYVLSVSMAAILLSIYYIFMWEGRPHLGARTSNDVEMMDLHNETGRLPMFAKYISYPDNLYNTSNRYLANNVTQDIPPAAALIKRDMTIKDNDVEFNITTELDTTTEQYKLNNELQQQLTAIESEETTVTSMAPTTSEESVTWPDDYDEEKSGLFMKKMFGVYY